MWTKICPYMGILLPFVLLLSTTDSSNAMGQHKSVNAVINSETATLIQHRTEIEIDKDKVYRLASSQGLSKINYIRQSINNITGDPFITVEMEASGLPPVDCVSVILQSGTSSPIKRCGGWDGSPVDISIPHAELLPELEELSIYIISQTNSTLKENLVDVSGIDFNTTGFKTTIGIVGSKSGDSNAFLRVQVGTEEEPVEVGGKTCTQGKTCYYPYSDGTIEERVKEIEVQGIKDTYTIKQYDDSIMPFTELYGDTSVWFSTEGVVHVSTTAQEEDLVLEVVVYDEKDPHNIVSKDEKYKCKVNRISNQTYSCSQEIQVTKELKSVWVLVVGINNDKNTVVQSTRKKIPINTSSGVEVWVIVVSTLGGLCGVILIAAAIFFTWKKRSTRNQKIAITSKVDNITMENKSNIPNESCFENEVENPNGNEKKTNYGNETENPNGDEKKTNNENETETQHHNKENNPKKGEENHYETIE